MYDVFFQRNPSTSSQIILYNVSVALAKKMSVNELIQNIIY